MASNTTPSSYVCDTIPPARLAPANPTKSDNMPHDDDDDDDHTMSYRDTTPTIQDREHDNEHDPQSREDTPQPPPRKLCVRHQRMADEGMNLKLQQSLDALAIEEREAVNAIWSNFSSSSHPRRAIILQGLLTMCCFSQLSLLTEQLSHLIRIDPFLVLPREVDLKILSYLDATSLCRAAQVSTKWRALADDNVLWRAICEQHIGQKCHKCGWGLPVLEKKRGCYRSTTPHSPQPSPTPSTSSPSAGPSASTSSQAEALSSSSPCHKRPAADSSDLLTPPVKRQRSEEPSSHSPNSLTSMSSEPTTLPPTLRPWKDVYSERMTVERNWRRGRCTVRTLKGHTDGVMCLQINETLTHPSFPVLITGSYDRTVRVWNLETGQELHCLKGHTRAVRALQFDEVKLITGSMDNTIKVWDWRRGKCIRTLTGHIEGVVCLNFDSNVLASGSVDSTIRVWNMRTGTAFTLRGHTDWVNSVQLWDSQPGSVERPQAESSSGLLDMSACRSPNAAQCNNIDPGKMLFSASDDGTIKLWDLTLRTCVRVFTGHVSQVQSMKLLNVDCDRPNPTENSTGGASFSSSSSTDPKEVVTRKKPLLVSGSLDNTIRMWDIESGKVTDSLFGHIEGVWSVALDKLRVVSGSHDRTIKVWGREDGKCIATLVGHQAAVTCLALGEDKIVSGSDDNDIKVWSFS